MDTFLQLWHLVVRLYNLFAHLDKHLQQAVTEYGLWVYAILFAVIFCETGLVILPFLPGDSLLFLVGSLAAADNSNLNIWVAFVLLFAAAVLGDTVNYHVGHYLGPKVLTRPSGRFLKKEHLDRTHKYFEKYGGSTIILARFVPIVRTFAPFVAGVGAMTYWKFLTYNVVGAVIWVGLLLAAGHWFGQMQWVKDNFVTVEIAIIVISLLPMGVEYLRFRMDQKRAEKQP
ncbi:MAG: DedA family protein [Planctomycetes bacterium]|nr:DedA family protein [Planctomycetota bacterium]